jgi:hypothetical protein
VIARLVLVALLGAAAWAGEHPRVELQMDACADAPVGDVKRFLAIDLGALLSDVPSPSPSPSPSMDATHAMIGCREALVALRVDDPITGKSLTREIDLAATPPAVRARLLALAVSELISASWTELETNAHPAVPPVGAVASPAARQSALAAVETRKAPLIGPLRIVALASGQFFFTREGALWGGGLRVGQDRARGFAWALDAVAHHGSASTSLGAVVADTLSVGPILSFHHRWTRVALRVGGGVRGGAARLEGQPSGPDIRGAVAWSGWLGPVAASSLTVAPLRQLALEVALEAGYVALPFGGRVDGTRQVAIDGAWIGAQLGVGLFR